MLRSTSLITRALNRSTPMIQVRRLGFMGESFNPFDDPFDPLNPINQVMIQNQKDKDAKKKAEGEPEKNNTPEGSDEPSTYNRPRLSSDY